MASTPDRAIPAARPFEGTVFRTCSPRFATTPDALSGDGAFFAAGRYHLKGAFRIVYTATSLEHTWAEFFGTTLRAGIAPADLLPVTVLAISVQLKRVLDLTDEATLRTLEIVADRLVEEDWSEPQRIGQAAFDAGFEALLAPAKAGVPNLNILVDNLQRESIVAIRNADQLPPAR